MKNRQSQRSAGFASGSLSRAGRFPDAPCFDDDIVDVAETGAVFEHLPGRVRVEVDLDEVLVAHGEQTVARDVGEDVVVDRVLIEAVAFDEQLGVKTEFEHGEPP